LGGDLGVDLIVEWKHLGGLERGLSAAGSHPHGVGAIPVVIIVGQAPF